MPIYQEKQLQEVSKQFQIYGDILYAEPTKIGHINETYMATYNQGGTLVRYIHQKINQTVFTEPLAVMDNLMRVTTHLRRRLEAEGARDVTRKALTIVPARDGKSYFCNGSGDYWRTFVFVERAQTFESVQTPRQAYEAGRAFGRFQHLLVDLPGKRLVETIPHFHHTRRRYEALLKAVAVDQYHRAAAAAREIDFALKHENIVDVLRKALDRGEIPERVAHNDTKFNNVMLDWESGEALCVLDLGYGDARIGVVRFWRHGADDDQPDARGREGPVQGGDANADVRVSGPRLPGIGGTLPYRSGTRVPGFQRETDHLHHRPAVPHGFPERGQVFPHSSAGTQPRPMSHAVPTGGIDR